MDLVRLKNVVALRYYTLTASIWSWTKERMVGVHAASFMEMPPSLGNTLLGKPVLWPPLEKSQGI